jgi:hypothetical protein
LPAGNQAFFIGASSGHFHLVCTANPLNDGTRSVFVSKYLNLAKTTEFSLLFLENPHRSTLWNRPMPGICPNRP